MAGHPAAQHRIDVGMIWEDGWAVTSDLRLLSIAKINRKLAVMPMTAGRTTLSQFDRLGSK